MTALCILDLGDLDHDADLDDFDDLDDLDLDELDLDDFDHDDLALDPPPWQDMERGHRPRTNKGGGGFAAAPCRCKYSSWGALGQAWKYGLPRGSARFQGVHWVSIRNESISRTMVRFQGYVSCNCSFISCMMYEKEQNT